MGVSQVEYIQAKELFPLTAKSASFNSDKFAVNNNPNISVNCYVMLSSSIVATAKIQGSLDNATWIDLSDTSATIAGDDEILWTLSELQSLMYVRVSVTISSGSAAFQIQARGT